MSFPFTPTAPYPELEVAKLANILPCVATAEYKRWPTAHYTALRLAAANGYKSLLLSGANGEMGKGGVLEEGALADVTLWDLTSLALLPKTDPARGASFPSSPTLVRSVQITPPRVFLFFFLATCLI